MADTSGIVPTQQEAPVTGGSKLLSRRNLLIALVVVVLVVLVLYMSGMLTLAGVEKDVKELEEEVGLGGDKKEEMCPTC